MSKKVEQLVMGAFYEAAAKIQDEKLPRWMPAEVEQAFAFHVARMIREKLGPEYDR